MRISQNGVDLIKHFEGLRLEAYQCSAGVWTIGYGHTRGVKPGDRITAQRAEELLEDDLRQFERDVLHLIAPGVAYTHGEFDALVSFAYNVGSDIDADLIPEGLGDSTLLKLFNKGDKANAADEFLKWNKARVNGVRRELEGLTRRRRSERALFMGLNWRVEAGIG